MSRLERAVIELLGTVELVAFDGRFNVGIDLESVEEWEELLATPGGQALLATRFTQEERAYIGEDAESIAGRWAAKEAVSKALGTGFRGVRPIEIEIVHEDSGQPSVHLDPALVERMSLADWRWSVTISHEAGTAIAMALGLQEGKANG